jgi:hypothetical protein
MRSWKSVFRAVFYASSRYAMCITEAVRSLIFSSYCAPSDSDRICMMSTAPGKSSAGAVAAARTTAFSSKRCAPAETQAVAETAGAAAPSSKRARRVENGASVAASVLHCTSLDAPSAALSMASTTGAAASAHLLSPSWREQLEEARQAVQATNERRLAIKAAIEAAQATYNEVAKEQAAAQLAYNVLLASSPSASIAQRCYPDALHSIFHFLSLGQLPRFFVVAVGRTQSPRRSHVLARRSSPC